MARLCFSLTVISIVIAIFWSSDGLTLHNSLLTGHVFKTIVSIDWLQCVQECHKHDMCISYNYFPPGEICELNNFGFNDRCEADDNLITANEWIHHAQVKHNNSCKHRFLLTFFGVFELETQGKYPFCFFQGLFLLFSASD